MWVWVVIWLGSGPYPQANKRGKQADKQPTKQANSKGKQADKQATSTGKQANSKGKQAVENIHFPNAF